MSEIQRINPPTGVILNERKYPVITNDPSLSDIFGNLRSEDYTLLIKSQLIGAPVGYWIGSRNYATRQSMVVGMLLFGSAALAKVAQDSAARLLGVTENSIEYTRLVERPGK